MCGKCVHVNQFKIKDKLTFFMWRPAIAVTKSGTHAAIVNITKEGYLQYFWTISQQPHMHNSPLTTRSYIINFTD